MTINNQLFAQKSKTTVFVKQNYSEGESVEEELNRSGYRKIGRREWTRTIDPHHVKVVL